MLEILGALLFGCVVSGVVPLVNAELLVVAAAVAVPPAALPLVVVASTVGQMVSKTLLFGLARWAPAKLPDRATARLDRAVEAVRERGGTAGTLLFASALVGLPPFYGLSLAAGVLGMPLPLFLATGTSGRALRFAGIAWSAHYLGAGTAELLADDMIAAVLRGG